MLSDVEPWNPIAPSTNRGAVEGGGGNRKVVAVRERNGPLIVPSLTCFET